jgi:hypothetical protein
MDDTDQLVQEALTLVPPGVEVPIDFMPSDYDEDWVVEDFKQQGCGCKLWKGKPCSGQFCTLYVKLSRLNFTELTTHELDLVIMGQLLANNNNSLTVVTESRHQLMERKKAYTTFYHQGRRVCPTMFRFLHRIGTKRLKNLA